MNGPRLVTPEAVELRFETASVGSRLLAQLIDLAVQAATLIAGLLALGVAAEGGLADEIGFVFTFVLVTFVILGYPVLLETLWRGRTLGKAALGLRVVTSDGAPVRFRHSTVRGFLMLVDLWMTTGAAGVLAILLTPRSQRLGDLAAGTLVLRERSGAGAPRAIQFQVPVGWEDYAGTLDVAGLGPDDYTTIRAFLLRAQTLPPAVRPQLAAQVASTVAARLRHTPPPNVPPEQFLVCVAALMQRREAPLSPGDEPEGWSPVRETWAAATSSPSVTAPRGPGPANGDAPARNGEPDPPGGPESGGYVAPQ